MTSLEVPQGGWTLRSPQNDAAKPKPLSSSGVLGLTLTDSMLEDMIKCVQNGKPIQLSLGEHPSLRIGTKTQHLSPSPESFPHELYKSYTSDTDSEPDSPTATNMAPEPRIVRVERMSNPWFMAMLGQKYVPGKLNSTTPLAKPTNSNPASATAGADAALAALKSSLASENAKKAENTTKYIKDGLPTNKRGAPSSKVNSKSKLLASNRSMPSSPALSGVGSPSLGPTSVPASQQKAQQDKLTRKPIVHLLAVEPMTKQAVQAKIPTASSHEILQALDKVGELSESTGKWELRKNFWRELDVWSYKYSSGDDRQRAIDNAVKQYDRARLGASEPEWDRLLKKEERGTGKCLSKLQAQIAQKSAQAPKHNVEQAVDSDRDANGEKAKKGDTSDKPASQPKAKKTSDKDAQAKRLFSKNPPKVKPAPAKKEKVPTTKTPAKVLSSQFVSDSDDEDEDEKAPVVSKAPPKPMKRSREVDAETSDSSVPLSKKIKKDIKPMPEASQPSRAAQKPSYSSSSSKTKGNSPQKSSPLASSPPTNASEFEHTSGGTSSSNSPITSLKTSQSPMHKRHQKSSSVVSSVSSTSSQRSLRPEVVDLARKYRSFYPKYEALHRAVAALEERNVEMEQDLIDMHTRLSGLKRDILAGVVEG